MANPDLADQITEEWKGLSLACINLAVHTGMLISIAGRYPEHVQENLIERLQAQQRWLEERTQEIYDFGEAFDE